MYKLYTSGTAMSNSANCG